MTKVELIGEEQLKRCLNNLPYQLKRKMVISSLKEAAMPLVKEAKRLAKKGNSRNIKGEAIKGGKLRRSIVAIDARDDSPYIIVGVRKSKKHAWYGHFVEFGTKGFGKRKRRVTGVGVSFKTGNVYTKRVTIAWSKNSVKRPGGLPERPYMRPAFESKKDEVIVNSRNILNKQVVTYLNKTVPRYVR